ncbi:titin-like isoform X2 [Alosa sapidissima]|uniref:titin-like isoform X2 n=1 Tax=Alosa sapidissima TaxID=34773 RepID=UPI001C08DC5E|nr:titin-like isoform X2 [Alosa sapidissima]
MMEHSSVVALICFLSLIDCGHCHESGNVPKLTHDKENQCLSKGSSVTLTCDTGDPSPEWQFLWYRVVPLRDGLPALTHTSGRSAYSLELLSDSSRGAGGSYNLNSTGPEHRGLYVCRAKKEEPVYYTGYSNTVFLWVNDPDSPGRLTINPNSTSYVESESLSLSCAGYGTGWTLHRITDYMEISQCPFTRGASSWENSTCHIGVLSKYDSGVYWCQSESGEFSNGFYIKVHGHRIEPNLFKDTGDQRLLKGSSVTFTCAIGDPSPEWQFLWYRVVPFRDDLPADSHWSGRSTYSLELLSDSSRGAGGSYSLNLTGPEQRGVYVCRAKKEEPVYYTGYSNTVFLWFNDPDPDSPNHLNINPNGTNFFVSESLSLSCAGNGTGWTLHRITDFIEISQCPFTRGASSWENSTCHIGVLSQYDSGTYWCQSESGEFSNVVFIKVHDVRVYITSESGKWMVEGMLLEKEGLANLRFVGSGHASGAWTIEGKQFEKGDFVKLRCMVEKSSVDRILWYRVVPFRDELSEMPHWNGDTRYSLELVSDGRKELLHDDYYILNPAAPDHSGLYVCRAERGEPAYYTYSSPMLIWIKDSSPGFLNLSPNRTQFYKNESVSFNCEVPGNASGWILRKYRNNVDSVEIETLGKATFNIKSLNISHSGNYWCQSESGEFSNIVYVRIHNRPRPFVYDAPEGWLTAGDSVSLRCSLGQYTSTSDPRWRILWYKIVLYREELPTFTDKESSSKYSLELLPDSSGDGGSYTLNSVGPEHSGVYVCREEREQPVDHTEYSTPKLLWVIDPSPKAALTINSNRTQYFQSESLSLSCVAQDNASGWSLRRFTFYYPSSLSGCPFNNTVTRDQSTCNISSLDVADSGVYWCQSESGQYSNAVKISVNHNPRPTLDVSPTWPAKGDTVTLKCDVSGSSSGWRFHFYRVIVPIEEVLPSEDTNFYSHELKLSENSTELLSDSSREAGGSYTLSTVGPEHTGFYVCRAQRPNSFSYTPYSNLRHLWVKDPSPPASLGIYPNKSDYFSSESVSLTCEVKGNSSGWTLRRFTNNNNHVLTASHCAFKHGAVTWDERPCHLRSLRTVDSGLYWCQSESGEYSNAVNISVHVQNPTTFLRVYPNHWVMEGTSVTMTCGVYPSQLSIDWKFYWYRVVPPGEGIPVKSDRSGHVKTFSVQLLTNSDSGSTESYNLSSVGPQHSGIYMCQGERGDYYTGYGRPHLVWVTSPSPSSWLRVSPNRTNFLQSQSLSLSCKGLGNPAEWTVRRYTSGELSDCPFNSRSGNWAESTCNISSLDTYDSGVYWCQSTSGELSNAVNITVHIPETVYSYISVSPDHWVTEGSAVTLSCSVGAPFPGVRFHWYKAVPVSEGLPLVSNRGRFREAKYSVELLSDSSRGAGGSYTLSSSAPEHSGLYVCRAEIEELAAYAEYSHPVLLTVTGPSPSVWLDVIPSRSQHFVSEPLTLACKAQDAATVWSVRRFTLSKELSDCPFDKKSQMLDPSTCNISSLTLSASGVYWCQSESGKRSNAVNITVHSGNVILESPVHPLKEGEKLTLRCLGRKSVKSNLSATFYKDGLHVANQTSGTFMLPNISKKDEGSYLCEIEEKWERRSPGSWVSVNSVARDERRRPCKRLKTTYQRSKDIL